MRDADDDVDRSGQDCHQSERALAVVAARQLGVVTRDQLYELGFTYRQLRRRLELGRLHRVHHNVFVVGHRRLSTQACLVAVLSVGPRSFLSHRTAAGVWGLRVVSARDIEVTLPGGGGRRHVGLTVHRTQAEPHPDEVRCRGDLRVSSVARLLVELAPRETPADPEIPAPQHNVHVGPWEIDRFWPAHRLAVELDGRAYHVAAAAMEKDRIKAAWLLKHAITPLRFTDFRVEHDPRGILSDLRHFLKLG